MRSQCCDLLNLHQKAGRHKEAGLILQQQVMLMGDHLPPLFWAYLSGLSGREQHGLPVLRQQADDLPHLLLEPDLQDPICLVNHHAGEVFENKTLHVPGPVTSQSIEILTLFSQYALN